MKPQAHLAAAIEIVDEIRGGVAAEAALTRWARGHRFAGSKDRAAIRDFVFEALRHWRSDAARGGGAGGRARMLGRLRARGEDPRAWFTGEGYAPDVLSAAERQAGCAPAPGGEACDLPDWLWARFQQDLGAEAEATARWLQARGPVSLRVNIARIDRAGALAALAEDGITAEANPRAATALTVVENARRLRQTRAYLEGLVELQDAASQAAIAALPAGARVLDYCAGGGGKALALAAEARAVWAHDADPARMRDLSERVRRAGVDIPLLDAEGLECAAPFDLVYCDAPCSGSGTWRRAPEAKWRLTSDGLIRLEQTQLAILEEAQHHVASGGVLAYATCSVLRSENQEIADAFLARNPGWRVVRTDAWPVDAAGDGFHQILLTRE